MNAVVLFVLPWANHKISQSNPNAVKNIKNIPTSNWTRVFAGKARRRYLESTFALVTQLERPCTLASLIQLRRMSHAVREREIEWERMGMYTDCHASHSVISANCAKNVWAKTIDISINTTIFKSFHLCLTRTTGNHPFFHAWHLCQSTSKPSTAHDNFLCHSHRSISWLAYMIDR